MAQGYTVGSTQAISVIDGALAVHGLPLGTSIIADAAWAHKSDTLVALSTNPLNDQAFAVRLQAWSMPTVAAAGYASDNNGTGWSSAIIDVVLGQYDAIVLPTVTVSPDDSTAAVVLPTQDGRSTQLFLVNLTSGKVRSVPNIGGPVGFTPDSSTIVGFPFQSGKAEIVLIDATTLATSTVAAPGTGIAPAFFVTSEGHDVVIASDGTTSGQAIVYDLTNHTSSALAASSSVLLSNFVARLGADELWLIGGDENLYELSLATAMLQKKPLSFVPARLNILTAHDLIVLDDTAGGDLHYYDPNTSSVAFSIVLPAHQ